MRLTFSWRKILFTAESLDLNKICVTVSLESTWIICKHSSNNERTVGRSWLNYMLNRRKRKKKYYFHQRWLIHWETRRTYDRVVYKGFSKHFIEEFFSTTTSLKGSKQEWVERLPNVTISHNRTPYDQLQEKRQRHHVKCLELKEHIDKD